MDKKRLSSAETGTKKIAGELLGKYRDVLQKRALLFALEGELGAGKTVFAKGIGEALGIERPIRSPSFVLVAEHPFLLCDVKGRLYHVDLWRVGSEKEARKLKIEDMIKPGNVILIEWVQKFPELISEFRERSDVKVIWVKLSHKGEEERMVGIVDSKNLVSQEPSFLAGSKINC